MRAAPLMKPVTMEVIVMSPQPELVTVGLTPSSPVVALPRYTVNEGGSEPSGCA